MRRLTTNGDFPRLSGSGSSAIIKRKEPRHRSKPRIERCIVRNNLRRLRFGFDRRKRYACRFCVSQDVCRFCIGHFNWRIRRLDTIDRHMAALRQLIYRQIELVEKGHNAERALRLVETMNDLMENYQTLRRRMGPAG